MAWHVQMASHQKSFYKENINSMPANTFGRLKAKQNQPRRLRLWYGEEDAHPLDKLTVSMFFLVDKRFFWWKQVESKAKPNHNLPKLFIMNERETEIV